MASAMTSVMNRCVPRSMPLAQAMTGVAGFRCGASVVAASRKFCAGVASRMMSARAAAAMSAVMPIPVSMLTPGSFGFFRVAFICAALSALRAYSMTSRPARTAAHASAVPYAPPPITATELKGRHVKIPRACWCSRPALSRWHRAASARGAARPSYRSARAPSVPRRPRRSSRRYRCTARAAE